MKYTSIVALAFFLSGCFPEKTYTPDEFVKDKDLYEQFSQKCNGNPGEYGNTPNCVNFYQAEKIKTSQDFRSFLK
jgi:hypothetical protein